MAIGVVSPARHRAAARQRTRMSLQRKRHNPLTPSSQITNKPHAITQISQSHQHSQYNPHGLPPHASQTAATPQSQPQSYPARSKHRNAATQTNNSHGRRSIECRRVIAELQVENTSSARHTSPPQQTNSSLNHNNKHHLAVAVRSPARDRAAARQRTRMSLICLQKKRKRHNPLTPSSQTTNHKPTGTSNANSNHPITTTQPIQSLQTAATCLPNSSYAEITTQILPSPNQAS